MTIEASVAGDGQHRSHRPETGSHKTHPKNRRRFTTRHDSLENAIITREGVLANDTIIIIMVIVVMGEGGATRSTPHTIRVYGHRPKHRLHRSGQCPHHC